MKRVKLTNREKQVEEALAKDEYADVSKSEFRELADAIGARKKDAVLNLRINSGDLANLKRRAAKLGVKYQTFISEILHRIAHS